MIVKNGYVMLDVLNPDYLASWIESLTYKYLTLGVILMKKQDYHVTLQYSETPINNYKTTDKVYNIDLGESKLSLFDSKSDPKYKYALVLELNSQELQDRNSYGKSLGATSNYAEYKPHITLAYLKNDIDPNFILEKPQGIIKLGNETIKDLDTDFKPIK